MYAAWKTTINFFVPSTQANEENIPSILGACVPHDPEFSDSPPLTFLYDFLHLCVSLNSIILIICLSFVQWDSC